MLRHDIDRCIVNSKIKLVDWFQEESDAGKLFFTHNDLAWAASSALFYYEVVYFTVRSE